MGSESRRKEEMNRRSFLKASGTGMALTATVGCQTPSSRQGGSHAGNEVGEFEFDEVTIRELQEGFAGGRWTAVQVTEAYLERIESLDRSGPTLRSIIEVNPEAVDMAEKLDVERREKGARGPLHGIPIVLKDNIDTADQMTTTAGSLALEGSVPERDSFVARRLREAGAILLAKANLSEWANFRSFRSSSGWSARGGQCRNPYVLSRNPCGSSSGSAAAVSANLCVAAIGTETNGSIVCPSNANGVVGVKPTLGLVSRSGIIPIAHSQDTAGPIARTLEDSLLVLQAIRGEDDRDPATAGSAERWTADLLESLQGTDLTGVRMGVLRQAADFHEEVDALLEESLALMADRGAVLVDPAEVATYGDFGDAEFEVLLYEFKADIEKYLNTLGPEVVPRTLADLIEFNESHAGREMPYFRQEIFELAVEKGPLTSEEYRKALASSKEMAGKQGIDATMEKYELDVIVAPTGGPAWVTDLVNGDHFLGGSSSLAAVSGYPSVTVPMGFIHGLPVGLSFFGRAWSEPRILSVAYAFEQISRARRAPRFLTEIPG